LEGLIRVGLGLAHLLVVGSLVVDWCETWKWTWSPVYTIQPAVKPVVKQVVEPVVQPVWQPVVSCKRGMRKPVTAQCGKL